jgi:hypothetical protein
MPTKNVKPNLNFEHIWEDDLMIELRVSASDGLFSGVTRIYTSWGSLNEFSNRLRGFPRTTSDIVEDANGEIGGYSYFRLVFRCITAAGHPIVEVEMEQNQADARPGDIRGRAKLGFRIDGIAVDRFVAQLQAMVDSKTGSALLEGHEG